MAAPRKAQIDNKKKNKNKKKEKEKRKKTEEKKREYHTKPANGNIYTFLCF